MMLARLFQAFWTLGTVNNVQNCLNIVVADNYVRCNDNAEKYVLDYCGIVGSVPRE